MVAVETREALRLVDAAIALECRSGPGQQEIQFEIHEDPLHNSLTLTVSAAASGGQWPPENPDSGIRYGVWECSLDRLAIARASHGPDVLFWEEMRRQFHPITPTAIEASVMRAYAQLWTQMFHTAPPPSVEYDLIQMGIFDVHFPPVRTREAPEAAGRLGGALRRFKAILRGAFSDDEVDTQAQTLAPPNSSLPVYRPK